MKNKIIIQKMYAYVCKIMDYCTGYDYSSFAKDSKPADACVFNLIQPGELCHKTDDEFIFAHKDIPWKKCTACAIA